MRRPRGHVKLASALVVCAVTVGVIAVLVVRHDSTAAAPTTGPWAPISVSRPKLPVIGGGIPVDIDPTVHRNDFTTTLTALPGTHRYKITISNTSNLGAINSFQWYPPTGVHIVKLIDNSEGHCILTGLTGFGGNQFPGLVLYPDVLCSKLDLKPPSCTCQGDGGSLTISFVTDEEYGGGAGEFRMRAATLVRDRIPSYIKPGSTAPSSG